MASIESNKNVHYHLHLKEPLLWEHRNSEESEQIDSHEEHHDVNTMMLLSMETGFPTIHDSASMSCEQIQFPWISFTITVIEVCLMVSMLVSDGFAPTYSNPLIGPSFQTINKFGAKNPEQILNGEYWRIIASIFLNIGLIDLTFSLAMILILAVHLERRWGSSKFVTIYIISGEYDKINLTHRNNFRINKIYRTAFCYYEGIGGNLYGLNSVIDSNSVGSGGCLVGLLGAVQVELVTSLLNGSFHKKRNGECKTNEATTQKMEASKIKEEEDHAILCSIVVGGMLLGMFTNITLEATYTSLPFRKDWSVLFGGMATGMVLNAFWIPFHSRNWRMRIQVACGLVVLLLPFLMDISLPSTRDTT